HGESDKVSMASNQAKAYDRVLVAGEAALRRYREALIEFDERRFVPVGRPQLDLRPEPVLPPTARRTVLYAPTWEGENAANNFTSVDVHGPAIAAATLPLPAPPPCGPELPAGPKGRPRGWRAVRPPAWRRRTGGSSGWWRKPRAASPPRATGS